MSDPSSRTPAPAEWPAPDDGDVPLGFIQRPCAVCGRLLFRGQRKVHAGGCARARETQLQQKRRQRARLAR